ncbi:hypothetical protein Hanom_Chr13g01185711 [Helianthus anomalus]
MACIRREQWRSAGILNESEGVFIQVRLLFPNNLFILFQLDLANGLGWVGLWVKTGSGRNGLIKKGVVLVRVETGSGQNEFRVGTGFGSGWLKMFF